MTYIIGVIEEDSISLIADTVVTYGKKQSTFKNNRSQFGEVLSRKQDSDAFKFFQINENIVSTFTSNNAISVLEFYEDIIENLDKSNHFTDEIKLYLYKHNLNETAIFFALLEDGKPELYVFENFDKSDYCADYFYKLSFDDHYIAFGSPINHQDFKSASEKIIETVDDLEIENCIDRLTLYCGLHQKLSLDQGIIVTGAGGVFSGCNVSKKGISWAPQMMYNIFELKSLKNEVKKIKINLIKVYASKLGLAHFSNAGKHNTGKFDHSFRFSYMPNLNKNQSNDERNRIKKRMNERSHYDINENELQLKNYKPEYVFNFIIGDIGKKKSIGVVRVIAVKMNSQQEVLTVSSYKGNHFEVKMNKEIINQLLPSDTSKGVETPILIGYD